MSTPVSPDLSWFEQAGLGLFIHWDHASQQGIEISWPLVGGIPEQGALGKSRTPEAYQASAATFDPVRWDPAAVARLARASGARYVVFTARHHSGYAMYHTALRDHSIEHSPYRRDITRELVDALRAEGLRIGLYYSLSDWTHPDYPAFADTGAPYALTAYPRAEPEAWQRYLGYLRGQLTELLTGYGPVDLLWFDGDWERTPEEWEAADLRRLIAELSPATVVNDRLPTQGDYATPEQGMPRTTPPGPWELCLTMSDTWAYDPDDTDYKSVRSLVVQLCTVASRNGNLLLNVGPRGDGSLVPTETATLQQIGAWMAGHGESIVGVEGASDQVDFYGPVTRRRSAVGETVYLHLVNQPVDQVLARGLPVRRVRGVRLLRTQEALEYRSVTEVHEALNDTADPTGEIVIQAPVAGSLVDVIAIDFDQPA